MSVGQFLLRQNFNLIRTSTWNKLKLELFNEGRVIIILVERVVRVGECGLRLQSKFLGVNVRRE